MKNAVLYALRIYLKNGVSPKRFLMFPCLFSKLAFMKKVKDIIEMNAFGVCTYLGDRMGIASSRIRLWFVYISFMTMGSPLIIYMIIAFWMNIKNYMLSARRNPLRYL